MDAELQAGQWRTTYPGFNTSGTDFGNPGTSPLQPTVLTLSLSTEQLANPMPAVKPATTTTIATSHQPPAYGLWTMQQYWQRIRTGMGAARLGSFALYYEIPGYAR